MRRRTKKDKEKEYLERKKIFCLKRRKTMGKEEEKIF